MKKLNDIIKTSHVTAYGFKALVDLAETSKEAGENVIVSALSPAVMAERGFIEYYAPKLPRGSVFNTAKDVENADLDVNLVKVDKGNVKDCGRTLIVSRHPETIEILKEMYPEAEVLSGNVSPEDINGAFVAGTLPPFLIQYAGAYQAFTINDFDYTKDGDLKGEELKNRSHICDPIVVSIE